MTIQITVDAFSGRPNPTWILDGQEARDVLREIAGNSAMLSDPDRGFHGLGFRGIEVQFTSDQDADSYRLPNAFKIAHGGSQYEAKAFEIAERLVNGMLAAAPAARSSTVLDAALKQFLQTELARGPWSTAATLQDGIVTDPLHAQLAAATCMIELGKFNPAFWNNANVQGRNNCYNYATNRRTDTFAQPGRGSGKQYTSLTCPAVTQAALADGNHVRFNCFGDAERPRWLMALVVAPGHDYHWYRKQLDGFWGHKPGGTAARNTDNNGQIILDPRTAARGPYTDFCGFFYSCRSATIR